MYTNTRVAATHRVWTIGLASPFPEVKMLALALLKEPVGSASDHIRMPAVYAIAEIANSTEDVRVKIAALTKLREPLQADQVPIRDAAIDAVNSITRSGDRDQVALAAVRELGAPVQSGNNGVRIPAINAMVTSAGWQFQRCRFQCRPGPACGTACIQRHDRRHGSPDDGSCSDRETRHTSTEFADQSKGNRASSVRCGQKRMGT